MMARDLKHDEIGLAARAVLRRAAHRHGRVELPLRFEQVDGEPGNPGTLVELAWSVTPSGILQLSAFIDGVQFWRGAA